MAEKILTEKPPVFGRGDDGFLIDFGLGLSCSILDNGVRTVAGKGRFFYADNYGASPKA